MLLVVVLKMNINTPNVRKLCPHAPGSNTTENTDPMLMLKRKTYLTVGRIKQISKALELSMNSLTLWISNDLEPWCMCYCLIIKWQLGDLMQHQYTSSASQHTVQGPESFRKFSKNSQQLRTISSPVMLRRKNSTFIYVQSHKYFKRITFSDEYCIPMLNLHAYLGRLLT